MDKPIFLLLGGNKLNYGILRKFQNRGYLVYVVDWNEHPQMTGDRHFRIDVKDSATIISALKSDGCFDHVRFAYSSIDLAVKSVAEIHRGLGLQTISDNGLANATSKCRMTACWERAGLLNRISRRYEAYDGSVFELARQMTIIIKPDNSASSRGITVIARGTPEPEIRKAFEKAQVEASDELVIVEEFVNGQEYTVEMLGDGNGNVGVYAISRKSHTANTENNKIAVKLHYNCEPNHLQEKIAEYGIKCYKALGFSNSFGHLEILLKPDGTISPVEIGARSSGCIASDLVDIVSGKDYLTDLYSVLRGGDVQNGLIPQSNKSSMYFFYDLPAGHTIVKECNLMDFAGSGIHSRYSQRERLKAGTQIGLIDSDNARIGFEILEGDKAVMTPEYIIDIERSMLSEMIG